MAQELGKDKAIAKELELEQGFKLLAENYADISEGEDREIDPLAIASIHFPHADYELKYCI